MHQRSDAADMNWSFQSWMAWNSCLSFGSSCNQACQCFKYSSGIGSSQPNWCGQTSCRISFAFRMNGTTNPRGSYTKLTMDSIPPLATVLSLITMLKPNVSDDTFHCTPNALFTGSLSKSSPFTFAALSDSGKDSSILFLVRQPFSKLESASCKELS